MSSQFPHYLDQFNNPEGWMYLSDSGVVHSEQHANANDAIENIQQTIGTLSSTNPNTIHKKIADLQAIASNQTSLSDDTPQDLGVTTPGVSILASRSDHVHAIPTATQIGAATYQNIIDLINQHSQQTDPHPQYTTTAEVSAIVQSTTPPQHYHSISDIINLQQQLNNKQDILIAGSGINITNSTISASNHQHTTSDISDITQFVDNRISLFDIVDLVQVYNSTINS